MIYYGMKTYNMLINEENASQNREVYENSEYLISDIQDIVAVIELAINPNYLTELEIN